MEISTDLYLSFNGRTLARITKCRVYAPSNTFAGVELTFELQIEPTDFIKDKEPRLERLVVDLYLMKDSAEFYLGQLRDRSIELPEINRSTTHQYQLELTTHAFLKLVDETHYKDLELRIKAQALIETDEPLKNSSGGSLTGSNQAFIKGETRAVFPLSEWHKILNAANIERFDLITLRTVLSELPKSNVFTQAFDKLKEAQDKFNRGDWNAVGAACRSAIRTIMSLYQGEKKPMDRLLASVVDDPERKKFSASVIAIWDTLNNVTHQEGNADDDLPPANLQREDALLTLHLTAVSISYIAAVHK